VVLTAGQLLPALVAGSSEKLAVLVFTDLFAPLFDYTTHVSLSSRSLTESLIDSF
jgi:hypothetical protein